MAELKAAGVVTFINPTDPKRTFTVKQKRFTPKNLEQHTEIELVVEEKFEALRDEIRSVRTSEMSVEEKRAAIADFSRRSVRLRTLRTYDLLRASLDLDDQKLSDQQRTWIELNPEEDASFFDVQDMGHLEECLSSFRQLLGIERA